MTEHPLQIDIKARDFCLTDAERNYAESRLRFTMTCCDDCIENIVMWLSQTNGPRGEVGKCCRVQVVLAGLPDLVIEDIETDLYIAIDRATGRAGRTLVRKVNR